MLKKFQKVEIYEDPITRTKLENKAMLLKYIQNCGSFNGKKLQEWYVMFDGETEKHRRVILED